jgi:hypothetical protein
MLELSKLESLALNLETMDEFTETYSKMLTQAATAKDKETIKRMRVVLHRQVAFLAVEAIKARKEESEEVVQ